MRDRRNDTWPRSLDRCWKRPLRIVPRLKTSRSSWKSPRATFGRFLNGIMDILRRDSLFFCDWKMPSACLPQAIRSSRRPLSPVFSTKRISPVISNVLWLLHQQNTSSLRELWQVAIGLRQMIGQKRSADRGHRGSIRAIPWQKVLVSSCHPEWTRGDFFVKVFSGTRNECWGAVRRLMERRGIEPRFAECDSAVIPLDHRPGIRQM